MGFSSFLVVTPLTFALIWLLGPEAKNSLVNRLNNGRYFLGLVLHTLVLLAVLPVFLGLEHSQLLLLDPVCIDFSLVGSLINCHLILQLNPLALIVLFKSYAGWFFRLWCFWDFGLFLAFL